MSRPLSKIHDTIADLAVPLDELTPYERNPRRGDVDLIADSLTENGQYRPVVARVGTKQVLAGNHTYYAAARLEWPRIAATWVDVDDDRAARIAAVDNRANDLAGYDDPLRAELLSELADTPAGLAGTGYTDQALRAILDSIAEPDFDPDENANESGLDGTHPRECPQCGYRWRVLGDGTVIDADDDDSS